MKPLLTFLILIALATPLKAQQITAVVISVESNKVLLDKGKADVKLGQVFKITKAGESITHPKTGKVIKREDVLIATLKITSVETELSEASVDPSTAISLIQVGMTAVSAVNDNPQSGLISVSVYPMEISGAAEGYVGVYNADYLTQTLFSNNKFVIKDRQSLGYQIDDLAKLRFRYGQAELPDQFKEFQNASYYIVGTIQVPEVIETETGLPIPGLVQLIERISKENLQSKDFPGLNTKKLRAVASVSIKVVDAKTGEIEFLCNEMAQAEGKAELLLEGGALGGLKLNGGAASYERTIVGQSTRAALSQCAIDIVKWFNGDIKERSYTGNVVILGKTDKKNFTELMVGDSVYFIDPRLTLKKGIIKKGIIKGIHTSVDLAQVECLGNLKMKTFQQIQKYPAKSTIVSNIANVAIGDSVIGYSSDNWSWFPLGIVKKINRGGVKISYSVVENGITTIKSAYFWYGQFIKVSK